jgi:hypothetical protein
MVTSKAKIELQRRSNHEKIIASFVLASVLAFVRPAGLHGRSLRVHHNGSPKGAAIA